VTCYKGMFGPIRVFDTPDRRALSCRGEVQGAAFLEPSAQFVSADHEGPGPVSACAYALGWLLAGLCKPEGSGLMIGLGSGAGVVQLLDNFPGIDLTVIEIDPIMVEAAVTGFPLLDYFANQGRLRVVIQDAAEFTCRTTDHWDFGFADAYTGENNLVDTYLYHLSMLCDRTFLNVIDVLDGPSMQNAQLVMDNPPTIAIHATPRATPTAGQTANWILATEFPEGDAVDTFVPNAKAVYEGYASAERNVRWWSHMMSNVFHLPVSAVC